MLLTLSADPLNPCKRCSTAVVSFAFSQSKSRNAPRSSVTSPQLDQHRKPGRLRNTPMYCCIIHSQPTDNLVYRARGRIRCSKRNKFLIGNLLCKFDTPQWRWKHFKTTGRPIVFCSLDLRNRGQHPASTVKREELLTLSASDADLEQGA